MESRMGHQAVGAREESGAGQSDVDLVAMNALWGRA
jgi:hypothetical protein